MAAKPKKKVVKRKGDGGAGAAARRKRRRKLVAERDAEERRIMGVVDAATSQRYGASDRVLAEETSRTSAHGATIDQVYRDYQTTVAGLAAQQQKAMQDAAAAQATTAAGVAGMQTQLGADQAKETTDTAARYGLDGGAQAQQAAGLAGDLGAVSGARAQARAGTTAAIGLAQAAQLQGASIAGLGHQQQDRKRNADELKILGGKKLDLEREKGDYKTTLRAELDKQQQELDLSYAALTGKERDSQRDDELRLLGLQIDRDRAAETARNNRRSAADRKADNQRADKLAKDTIKDRAERRATANRKLDLEETKGSKMTASQQSQWTQRKARILELKSSFKSLTAGQQTFGSTAELSKYLGKRGYTRVEINMARDLATGPGGKLSPQNLTAARSYFPTGLIPKTFGG